MKKIVRLIDADALIRKIADHGENVAGDGPIGEGYALAHRHIIDLVRLIAGQTGRMEEVEDDGNRGDP